MFTWFTQISCTNIIPYEPNKLKVYSQPQLITPVCIQTFHPSQHTLIQEDIMYIQGEKRIVLQFSVLLDNFSNPITKFGLVKLKKRISPQQIYLPHMHKPSYIRIPSVNENACGFTVKYTMFVEECTPNPKIIQEISIMSPNIIDLYRLKMNLAKFLLFLGFGLYDELDDFAFRFCVIVENHDTQSGDKTSKLIYSQPFQIVQEACGNLKLLHVDPNDYHLGIYMY